ncbi:hypothetical protein ACFL0W_00045 [Nanoarchaeota archaeon]
MLLAIPGFFLSFTLIKKNDENFSFAERYLASIAFTYVFFIIAYFFTFIGLPVNKLILFGIMFLLPISLSLTKRADYTSFLKEIFSNKNINSKTPINILLIILFILLIFSPVLNEDKLQRTTGVATYVQAYDFVQSVEKYKEIPILMFWQEMGVPDYASEPYFFYFAIGYNKIMTDYSLNKVYNYYVFFTFVNILIGMLLLSRLLKSKWPLVSSLFILISPYMTAIGFNTGLLKMMSSFIFVPIFFILFFKSLKQKEYYLPTAIAAVTLFFAHTFLGNISFGIAAFIFFYFKLHQKIVKKESLFEGGELKSILKASIVFVIGILTWLLAAVYYTNHSFGFGNLLFGKRVTNNWLSAAAPPINTLLKYIFGEPGISNQKIILGLYISILAVCAIGISVYYLLKEKEKDNLLPLIIMFSIFSYTLLYYTPLNSILKRAALFDRVPLFIFFGFCLIIPRIFEIKNKTAKIVFAIILLVLIFHYGNYTYQKVNEYESEQIQTGKVYAEEMAFLKSLPIGRTITYGLYGSAVDSVLPIFTNKPSTGHASGYGVFSHSGIFWEKTYSERKRSVPPNTTSHYIKNLLSLAWTKYIIIGIGMPGGDNALNVIYNITLQELIEKSKQNQTELDKILKQKGMIGFFPKSTILIFENTNAGSLAEKVKISQILMEEKALYEKENAFKVVGFKNYVPEKYDYVVNKEEDIQKVEYPVQLDVEFDNPRKINIKGPFKKGEWVLVKLHEFPNWHAFMNGKEVQIERSNTGFMLIKAEVGSNILLRYDAPFFSQILQGLLSAAIIFCFLIPAFLSKRRQRK